MLRIAHLSDPHFAHITYSPMQFLSKRWIGNLNLIFSRQKHYDTKRLWQLPSLFKELSVEAVFLTGDFATTSLPQEFEQGSSFIQAFHKEGLPLYCLPGNHDSYTRFAEKKRFFYRFLAPQVPSLSRIEKNYVGKNWWYIGLDCAIATPPFCAYGIFSKGMERGLFDALNTIPEGHSVIVANHFPLYSRGRPWRELKRSSSLQHLLAQFSCVKLYLHGHDHQGYVIQKEGMPLVINAGSVSHVRHGKCFIIDLTQERCVLTPLLAGQGWHTGEPHIYHLDDRL